jgi:hypothetical protein
MMERHRITFVKPLEVGRLQLWFAGGPKEGFVVDLSPMLALGGVFEPLRDQVRWNAVEITDSHHALVWHDPSGLEDDDIDLCADALYLTATGTTFTPSTAAEVPR